MEIELPGELVKALRLARNVVVLTGAGTSAESGVPTFREAQTGLWSQYDPQQLATPRAFQRDPRLVWEWYAWRRSLVSEAEPNAGHLALARLAGLFPNLDLITQNVDGLHQRAGSTCVMELHGNIMRTKCFDCGVIVDDYRDPKQPPPRCTVCHGLLRPDVVWFGESLPYEVLSNAFAVTRACDIFFSIGTSSVVQPAASLPFEALKRGALTVEINPVRTPLSPYITYVLSGTSGAVLPDLVQATWPT